MTKLWSNVVLICSTYSLVVSAPAPQVINPYSMPGMLPYNYITFARGLNPNTSAAQMNPFLPARIVAGASRFDPKNPFNVASTGWSGGLNTLSEGFINTGLALSGAVQTALFGVTSTLGNLLSGMFGDGLITDQVGYNPLIP